MSSKESENGEEEEDVVDKGIKVLGWTIVKSEKLFEIWYGWRILIVIYRV